MRTRTIRQIVEETYGIEEGEAFSILIRGYEDGVGSFSKIGDNIVKDEFGKVQRHQTVTRVRGGPSDVNSRIAEFSLVARTAVILSFSQLREKNPDQVVLYSLNALRQMFPKIDYQIPTARESDTKMYELSLTVEANHERALVEIYIGYSRAVSWASAVE